SAGRCACGPGSPGPGARRQKASSGGAALLVTRLLVLDDLGLDDLVVVLGRSLAGLARLRVGGLGLRVDRAAHLLAHLRGVLGRRPDRVGVGALKRLLDVRDRRLHLGLHVVGHLVGVLGQELLGGVGQRLGAVADLGLLAAVAVLLSVLLGVGDHALDVVLAQRGATRD